MPNQKLVEFLKNNINKHTLAEIKNILMKQGWKESDIDEAAESALHSHGKVNDLLNVGKEDLILGKVKDVKEMNTGLERTPVEGKKDAVKLFLYMGLGVLFVIGMGFGGYVLLTGDEDVIGEKVIDPEPVNTQSEALGLMAGMFTDFNVNLARLSDEGSLWNICYADAGIETCCDIKKADGDTNCETYVL